MLTFLRCFRHFRASGYTLRRAAVRALHVARFGFHHNASH